MVAVVVAVVVVVVVVVVVMIDDDDGETGLQLRLATLTQCDRVTAATSKAHDDDKQQQQQQQQETNDHFVYIFQVNPGEQTADMFKHLNTHYHSTVLFAE